MGLLGFDLDENSFFYRRLPFKTERILSLNPRMIAAEKLLEEDKVEIIANDGNRTEARVAGSGGVRHTVILDRENEKNVALALGSAVIRENGELANIFWQ